MTGLESAVWQLTFFVFICKTDLSKPVKQEVNGTVILPPLVFPGENDGGREIEKAESAGMLQAFLIQSVSMRDYYINYDTAIVTPGNTKGGSITALLTSCLTGLESAV